MKTNFFYLYISCLFLLGTALFGSCQDDDDFTTSSTSKLTFEADTIRFDTVITTIGSSTKRFKVFNQNDKGLHISSVELESGGASGFRVNVDGHSSAQLSDIEILKKDSIFIFAEVTLPIQGSNFPEYVSDKLIFNLESGVRQEIVLEAYGQDATFLHAPRYSSDTELSNERPYIIYDSLVVDAGATLTIPEGTILMFHQGAYMGVHGTVECNGTLEHQITFRGDRTDKIFSYLPYDRMDAQWDGVILYPESSNNVFDYVDIHGGKYGIDCPLSTSNDYKLFLHNSMIHNVSGDGLRCYYCIGQVLNSQISNAGNYCVNLIGGSYNFVHTTIAQFYPWSSHETALYFTNVVNDTIYPLEQANFYNCLITGASTDEIVGNRLENSDASFNVIFNKCLINVKITGKEPEDILNIFSNSVNETGNTKDWKKDKDGVFSDDIIWGAKNFLTIDHEIFNYDFGLSDKSNARGIGDGKYVDYCPTDRNGVARPTENPDVGCYQFVEKVDSKQ